MTNDPSEAGELPVKTRELPEETSSLTIGAIVGAAEEDIERRKRNMSPFRGPGEYEHYAFHRKHVAKARIASELLVLALHEREIGVVSGKKWTRLIYKDKELLKAAAFVNRY
jgi:molybdate-binding protein